MDPILAAVAGPLTGTTHSLEPGRLTVGRQAGNSLCLPDPLLSRQHCIFRREGNEVSVVDLDSLNGTFVNDVPVRDRVLRHGDRITLGESVFLFQNQGEEAEIARGPDVARLLEHPTRIQTAARLRAREAIYLRGGGPLETLPLGPRTVRDLEALLRLSLCIASARGRETVERQLLESLGEMLPAERGAIVLTGSSGELASGATWSRAGTTRSECRVSRNVVTKVLADREGIVSNEVGVEESFKSAPSIATLGVSSLLCVPLLLRDRPMGVIWLDASDPVVRFDQGDLELATAVASLGALALDSARHLEAIEEYNRLLEGGFGNDNAMVGESPAMREVYQLIAKVAPADTTVLVCGESGTGKELAARAIHRASSRSGKPFVVINCAVLSETLLESDLFGHEKGAFTGAIARKKGKLELAQGGTVFLDEIAEMAPQLQAKLLRVLQEREIERVGGADPIRIDVRVIAATNRNLEEEMSAGRFRPDLYYRLNVVSVRMPPLRDRPDDIPLLASFFASRFAAKLNRRITGISPEARECLFRYDWPGNVRELENAIERAVVLGCSETVLPEDLPEPLHETGTGGGGGEARYHEGVRDAKKALILEAVKRANGRFKDAATLLGVHPNYLHRLIRNLNLRPALQGVTGLPSEKGSNAPSGEPLSPPSAGTGRGT